MPLEAAGSAPGLGSQPAVEGAQGSGHYQTPPSQMAPEADEQKFQDSFFQVKVHMNRGNHEAATWLLQSVLVVSNLGYFGAGREQVSSLTVSSCPHALPSSRLLSNFFCCLSGCHQHAADENNQRRWPTTSTASLASSRSTRACPPKYD